MEISGIRMKAYLIDLDKIEVELMKQYYGGISPRFYLRNLNTTELTEIKITRRIENDTFYSYYFDDITIDLMNMYEIVDNYGLSETLQYVKLVNLADFDDLFYYSGDDLGATYYPDRTIFKVWSPTALEILVRIEKEGQVCSYPLVRNAVGVFSQEVYGYYDNCKYTYLVKHHTTYEETTDPYSYGSSSNAKKSIVIDVDRIRRELHCDKLPPMSKKTEAIIYETSVRDFTMHDSIATQSKGKFLGMVEEGLKTASGNLAGIDYLCDLGITHVQLMPIFDFATVDENFPTVMYNWGYDPQQYNVPEGSYCEYPEDGYSRIIECQDMVAGFHAKGLRVVMDVVYNHMYDINTNAFEKIVPSHFFRKDSNGNLTNGSWCGNDLNTTALMVRKYIIDMCLRWQNIYGMDGYRFDLMGLMDIKTMQLIDEKCKANDPAFMVYGEGWNMNTGIPEDIRATQENHAKIESIGFFNDQFRDKLKGRSSGDSLGDKGYFAGNMYNTGELCQYLLNINRYTRSDQSINYVECHDNATTFDKLAVSNVEETLEIRKKRQLLINCACIIAQGIPFLHSGQEFYRTKGGRNNTYNSLDTINALDWNLKDANNESVELLKQVIKIRKENDGFKYETKEEVQKNCTIKVFNHHMVKYTIQQSNGKYQTLVIYINASKEKYPVDLEGSYDVLYNDVFNKEIVEIQPISMVILGLQR